MTVATSTAGGEAGGGDCFLAQERQKSPARRNRERLIAGKSTLRDFRNRDARISTSEVSSYAITRVSRGRLAGALLTAEAEELFDFDDLRHFGRHHLFP